MEPIYLLKDDDKYNGDYVAIRSFTDREVICHGLDPIKVYNDAKGKGVSEPVVFYVPEEDVVQIYVCF